MSTRVAIVHLIICHRCKVNFKANTSARKYCSAQCRLDKKRELTAKFNGRVGGITTGTIGAISELMACADLMKNGYEVFRAMSPSSNSDVIGIKDGIVHLYEVRTGNYSETSKGILLTWSNVRSEGKEMLVITFRDNKVHHIPGSETGRSNRSVYVKDDGAYEPFVYKKGYVAKKLPRGAGG